MKAVTKLGIFTGKDTPEVPKGTEGFVLGVTNSSNLRTLYPFLDYKAKGWYYLCRFAGHDSEVPCTLSEINLDW